MTRAVPRGYETYVRILHPPTNESGVRMRWADAARMSGRVAHAAMQWPTGSWTGGEPSRGRLAPDLLEVLCSCLAEHTTTPDACCMGVWDGWGDLSAADRTGPELELPGRRYVLSCGSIARVGQVIRAPNILWPTDRAWFVASEIDFDSTLVGGGGALRDDLLARPELEAWGIGPEDSLAIDGDRVNGPVQVSSSVRRSAGAR